MSTIDVDRVVALAARGFSVFPCRPRGKQPLTQHGYRDSSTDEKQIREWWLETPTANVGIDCGGSDLLVLDVDGEEGEKSLAQLLPDGAPATTIVGTGKGRHLYFRSNGKKRYKNLVSIQPGLDIRTDGGSVIAPPSIHANGNEYRFESEVEPAPVPIWLEAILEQKGNTSPLLSPEDIPLFFAGQSIPQGTRNTVLQSIAGTLRRRGLGEKAIEAALLVDNVERCKPPLPEADVRDIAHRIIQYQPAQRNFTDLGNAERLIDRFGEDLLFDFDSARWLIWDRSLWKPDRSDEIVLRAKDVARELFESAFGIEDHKEAETIVKHAVSMESRYSISSMIKLAQPFVPITTEQLDSDPLLLNCRNRTIDLRTGDDFDPRKTDYITKQTGTDFDVTAACPRWEQFIHEIFDGDLEVASFVQRSIGYALTGDVSEQSLFVAHGSGANGKSTLIETLHAMLGDYSRATTPETVMSPSKARSGGQATPDVAMLPGLRFVSASETEESKALNEPLIKQLTGSDSILARHLYAEFFEFRPAFKLWLVTNHLPTVVGDDFAIWRRIKKIPFNVRFEGDQADHDLGAKLLDELPGILNWCILGCLEWQRRGLDTPGSIDDETERYRQSQDVFGDFVTDRVETVEAAVTTKKEFYQIYVDWCKENGESAITQRAVSMKLTDRGYVEKRLHGGIRAWQGIAVRSGDR